MLRFTLHSITSIANLENSCKIMSKEHSGLYINNVVELKKEHKVPKLKKAGGQ